MVVAAVVHKCALAVFIRNILQNFSPLGVALKVQVVRYFKTQQVLIEPKTGFHIANVKAEMAQSPNLEGSGQVYSTHVIKFFLSSSHFPSPALPVLLPCLVIE